MSETSRRSLLSVAVVGVGRAWETHYRDAVHRLSHKLAVRAVCDPVHVRAGSVAEEFRAATYSCPWKLAQRRDIQAWLICDPAWFGTYPAELAVRRDQPALIINGFAHDPQRLTEVFTQSLARTASLVVELPNRFAPATTRLRELIATKLGEVRQIEVDLEIPSCREEALQRWLLEEQASSLGLFDWCTSLVGGVVTEVNCLFTDDRAELRLDFQRAAHTLNAETPSAILRFASTTSAERPLHRRRLNTERGTATSDNPNHVVWQTESDHGDESLLHERSPFEIILDQFCRRAAGGLLPVPGPQDALKGLALIAAAARSLSTGQPVSVKSVPVG